MINDNYLSIITIYEQEYFSNDEPKSIVQVNSILKPRSSELL